MLEALVVLLYHRLVGPPKSSDKNSGHTARVCNKAFIVSKRLLENHKKETVLGKTMHALIIKKEHKQKFMFIS